MRRGHASTKIPNVKLRPAPVASSSKSSNAASSASVLDEDESGDFDNVKTVSRPLKGVIVCCTGIKEKVQIMTQATELGAVSCSDFTDRVTHLIAQAPGSAKFKCALERGVPIMEPAWISRTYNSWLKGVDMSLEETVAKFRLPPFSNMYIALTGEQDISRRVEIGRMVNDGNGRYMKEIGPLVTHLLVCGEEGMASKKFLWVQDLNEQRKRQGVKRDGLVHIVWVEWLLDCQAWNGKWDEADYSIEKPRPSRRESPPVPFFEPPSFNSCFTSTQQQPRISNSTTPSFSEVSQAPKTSTSEDFFETASRKPSQPVKEALSKRLWDEIRSNTQSSKGKGREADTERPQKRRKAAPTQSDTEDDEMIDLARINDTKQGASGLTFISKIDASRTTSFTTRTTSSGSTRSHSKKLASSSTSFSKSVGPVADPNESAPFAGLRICTIGAASDPTVLERIQELGGTATSSKLSDNLRDADYIIVRLQESGLVPKNHPLLDRFRTECWLEACDLDGSLCPPDECVIYTPLKINLPLKGSEQVRLVYSGLDTMQSTFLKRLCTTLGITIAERFNRQTTHLICPERKGMKYEKSLLWNIPIHDLDWLWQVARSGSWQLTEQTVEASILPDITNSSSESASSVPLPSENRTPGKVNKTAAAPNPGYFGRLDPSVFSDSPLSSPSKSPAKINTAQLSPVRLSCSPATLQGRNELPNLGPAISALLGRHRKEDFEPDAGPERNKRTRPPSRSKALFAFAQQSNRVSGSVSPTKVTATSIPLPPKSNADTAPESNADEEEESMRVVYHDPAQQAEKQKLMAILGKNDPGASAGSGSSNKMEVDGNEKATRRPAPRRKTRNAI